MKSTMLASRTLLLLSAVFAAVESSPGCSCAWNGPFLMMAPQSKLIVRVKVLSYFGKDKDRPLAMNLSVLEVLSGQTVPSPLRVWGDTGMLCRPYVSQFPIGTEWIFALDGPGSKPGMTPDHAISVCGQFWLRVTGDEVAGNIDVPGKMDMIQKLPIGEFRNRLAVALSPADQPKRASIAFDAEIGAGEVFERPFDRRLLFRLEPSDLGWLVCIRERGRDEDLSRLTPPFHGVPNPREIEGWHFRNADNTGPNEPGDRNINAPGELREFIYSPEVGRTIAGPDAGDNLTPEQVEKVRAFGRGSLKILASRLGNLVPGKQARMEWMHFRVELSWPQ